MFKVLTKYTYKVCLIASFLSELCLPESSKITLLVERWHIKLEVIGSTLRLDIFDSVRINIFFYDLLGLEEKMLEMSKTETSNFP